MSRNVVCPALLGADLLATDALRMRVPIYSDTQAAPVAVLRAERLSTEFEKRGFFQVGLFPRAIFTGVTLELDSQERLPESLKCLERLLEHSRKGQPWELRLVRVTFRSGPARELAFGRMSPDGVSAWRFENLSQVQPNGQARAVPSGRLLAGAALQVETHEGSIPLADWLAYKSEPRSTLNP